MAKKRKRKPQPARRGKPPVKRKPSRRPPPKRPTRRKPKRTPAPKPKARKKAAPKAAPSTPRVKTRPAFIRTRVITQYRKGGRIVKRGTKGASRFRMEQQLNERGRVVRTLELLSRSKVIKTIYSGAIEEEGMSMLMPSGQRQGSLMHALFESNVTTQYRGARLIEVQIKGVDARGKERRVKVSIEPTKTRRLHELVLSRIIQAMREAEVRTQYTIEILRAAKADGPLKYPLSYQKFRTLDPLTQVEIVITIYR
jgi:hypothetical protein